MKKITSWVKYSLLTIALVILDYITKQWAVAGLKGKENIVWIKGVFELEYLENTGAAFSMMLGKQTFLIILSIVVLAAVIWKAAAVPEGKRFILLRLCMSTLAAGAIGNMIDRIWKGYVVDFFYFTPINFPRFNVADCYVVVSVIVIAILILFVYKEDEIDFLFRLRKKK